MTAFFGMMLLVLRSFAAPAPVPQAAQLAPSEEPVIIIVD